MQKVIFYLECKSGCGAELSSYSHCKPIEHLTNGQNSYCNGHSVVDQNGHQGKDEGGGNQQSQYKYVSISSFDPIIKTT